MTSLRNPLWAVLLALLLAGCGHEETPTPPPEPPTLARPVVQLKAKPETNIWVARQAVTERGGVPGVFVLNTDNQARFRMVRIGRSKGAQVEVISGLTGYETLVLGDLQGVRDGSPIKTK